MVTCGPHSLCEQTDTSESITFTQTSLAGGNNIEYLLQSYHFMFQLILKLVDQHGYHKVLLRY